MERTNDDLLVNHPTKKTYSILAMFTSVLKDGLYNFFTTKESKWSWNQIIITNLQRPFLLLLQPWPEAKWIERSWQIMLLRDIQKERERERERAMRDMITLSILNQYCTDSATGRRTINMHVFLTTFPPTNLFKLQTTVFSSWDFSLEFTHPVWDE